MNILFLFYKPIIPNNGGVQRVTYTLSEYFKLKGIHSKFLCPANDYTVNDFLPDQLLLPDYKLNTNKNKEKLASIITEHHIDLIINQMSYFKEAIDLIEFTKKLNIKIFTVCHIAPSSDWNYFYDSHYKQFVKLNLIFFEFFFKSTFFASIINIIFRHHYSKKYYYAVEKSDKFILLSKLYIPEVVSMLHGRLSEKFLGIPNPIPFEINKKSELKKEVLYVGRVSINQKRLDLLIRAWSLISKRHNDWILKIVGDGPDLRYLKQLSKKLCISNISFEGKQNPIKYYEKASIIAMSSTYEGFPMTLIEAISFGLVPVAFNSFAAISDVVFNNFNGLTVEPFNIDKFASTLDTLMSDKALFNVMSNNCIEHAKNFKVDEVGKVWINEFYNNDLI